MKFFEVMITAAIFATITVCVLNISSKSASFHIHFKDVMNKSWRGIWAEINHSEKEVVFQ